TAYDVHRRMVAFGTEPSPWRTYDEEVDALSRPRGRSRRDRSRLDAAPRRQAGRRRMPTRQSELRLPAIHRPGGLPRRLHLLQRMRRVVRRRDELRPHRRRTGLVALARGFLRTALSLLLAASHAAATEPVRLVLLGTAGGPTPKAKRAAPAEALQVGDR